jgi:phosphoribosylamine---glycine ligase
MNILVLGGGGREHALAWKLEQSPSCDTLFVAPGNAGNPNRVNLDPLDFPAIASFVRNHQIGLLVVGPEAPLVAGIVDYFKVHEDLNFCKIIGPDQTAAQLEGSKVFAKQFMARHNIPTAPFQAFQRDTLYLGFKAIDAAPAPYVLKADGLAAGKGVLILQNPDDAKRELAIMTNPEKYGAAGKTVLLEAFLTGKECSVFALCDGEDYVLLPTAKDYKRIGEGDQGPNTGGMGAISPWPEESPEFMHRVTQEILEPVLRGMKAEGHPYTGFLYIGLMVDKKGNPLVIEFNARMGDPETQAVMLRIDSDLVPFLEASTRPGGLKNMELKISTAASAAVVLAAPGYPAHYPKDLVIHLSKTPVGNESVLFHAGTKQKELRLLSSGGRVFAAAAKGVHRKDAIANAYSLAESVQFEGVQFRRDIGYEWQD